LDLFKDIIGGILWNKAKTFEDPEAQKAYLPFMVNRALSMHQDSLFYANEMNLYSQLDKKPQIDFYLNTVRPRKRAFIKWSKPIKVEDLDAVKTYYGYSDRRAMEAMKLLTEEQITFIKMRTDTGE
jgi:hypothetical protein